MEHVDQSTTTGDSTSYLSKSNESGIAYSNLSFSSLRDESESVKRTRHRYAASKSYKTKVILTSF